MCCNRCPRSRSGVETSWRLDASNEGAKGNSGPNSVGVILPKEILERLSVKRGDSLYAIETKNELTAYKPEFAKQVEVAELVMREDRDALRKLAK
jgi:putative addiction module antidote